jgi:NAD(P)-dependent dehydrogenase (short-subunit alcohol dehydrogenase family)
MEKILRLAYYSSKNRRAGGFCYCWGLVLGAAFRGNNSSVVGAAAAATAGCSFITTSVMQSTRKMRPGCCHPVLLSSGMTTWSTMKTSSSFDPSEHSPPGTRGTPVFNDIDFSVGSQDENDSESAKRNRDPKAVFVVTGANRGLGLEFCKALLQRTAHQAGSTIVACCRSPESAKDLLDLAAKTNTKRNSNNRIMVIGLDLESQESIEQAGREIRQRFDRVDLLLNVAGILGDGGKTTPGPERSLTKMDRSWLEKSLAVNVIGPVMFTKELAPLLMHSRRAAVNRNSNSDNSRPVSVVANLSARVGSITDNGLGGWYSYRMSKAALNQATRTMALEMKRHHVWCVALHPGTTDTNLSKPFQANVKTGSLFPVEYTVNCLLKVVDSLQPENSGGFYDWAGKVISF